MTSYVVIESRDPFDSADVERLYELAEGLAAESEEVTVFLVQNGVFPARGASIAGERLRQLAASTTVLADEFSLRERGIRLDEIVPGVRSAPIDRLVELVVERGHKAIWH